MTPNTQHLIRPSNRLSAYAWESAQRCKNSRTNSNANELSSRRALYTALDNHIHNQIRKKAHIYCVAKQRTPPPICFVANQLTPLLLRTLLDNRMHNHIRERALAKQIAPHLMFWVAQKLTPLTNYTWPGSAKRWAYCTNMSLLYQHKPNPAAGWLTDSFEKVRTYESPMCVCSFKN